MQSCESFASADGNVDVPPDGELTAYIDSAVLRCTRLQRIILEVEEYASYVPDEVFADIQRALANFRRIKAYAQGASTFLAKCIGSEIFPGEWDGAQLMVSLREAVRVELEAVEPLLSAVESKSLFLKALESAKVIYASSYQELAEVKARFGPASKLLILFFEQLSNASGDAGEIPDEISTRASFIRRTKEELAKIVKSWIPVAVDLDMDSRCSELENLPPKTQMYLYSAGSYCVTSMPESHQLLGPVLAIRTTFGASAWLAHEADNRVPLYLPIGREDRKDAAREIPCMCALCGEAIEYGFNSTFYCDCGATPVSDYHFSRCLSDEDTTASSSILESLSSLRPLKEVNVLLLAERHVGKSSWLNSIPNLMFNESFAEAVSQRPIVLTPSSFWTADDQQGIMQIKGAESRRNDTATSEDRHIHTLRTSDTLYRFIDLLIGLNAAETAQRMEEIKQMLQARRIETLHSTCILIRSNERKLNMMLPYQLQQIKHMIGQDFAKNGCICLTHSRESFFRPGDVMPLLHTVNNEFELGIPLAPGNIFCTDSEHLRYLRAIQQGVSLHRAHPSLERSWPHAIRTTREFLSHLSRVSGYKIPLVE